MNVHRIFSQSIEIHICDNLLILNVFKYISYGVPYTSLIKTKNESYFLFLRHGKSRSHARKETVQQTTRILYLVSSSEADLLEFVEALKGALLEHFEDLLVNGVRLCRTIALLGVRNWRRSVPGGLIENLLVDGVRLCRTIALLGIQNWRRSVPGGLIGLLALFGVRLRRFLRTAFLF
jgi:hypothetical protein